MFELKYKDSYNVIRSVNFDTLDDVYRTLLGCFTIPEYLEVESFTYKQQDLGYTGTIGDLYNFVSQLDPKKFEN